MRMMNVAAADYCAVANAEDRAESHGADKIDTFL